MKKFYSILVALLAMVNIAASAADVPVSGQITAGVEYSIPVTDGSSDDYYTTSEVIGAGQTIVVFYYNHSTEAIFGQTPMYFGPGGANPLSRDKTLKDAAGNSVCRLVANTSNAFDASGHAVIEVYQPKDEGATWTYVICSTDEAATMQVPSFGTGGGGDVVAPIAPVSGSLVQKTEYTIPGTGNSFDQYYTASETLSAGQTIVVFYYQNDPGTLIKTPVYFGPGGKNPLSTIKNEKDANGNTMARIIANAETLCDANGHPVIELYQPDNEAATWAYVICSEDEAATVAAPAFGGGGGNPTPPEVVPGQNAENAIVLENGVAKEFKSAKDGTYNVLFAKFVAGDDGVVTISNTAEYNKVRWMEEGVMQYNSLKQNLLIDGKFSVEKDHTYYLYYEFANETEGTLTYSLTAAEEGSTRSKAILLSASGTQNLRGIPHVNDDYFNADTWFKLDNQELAGMKLMTVAIGGSNETEITLHKGEETKSYFMGSGSGMLPRNSTVQFDIDLSEGETYVSISQDDVNGTATFTFTDVVPGQSIGTAIEAVLGNNTVAKNAWYKYTHVGDPKMVSIKGTSTVVDANEGLVAEGEDVALGFVMADGETVYFQATTVGFTVNEREIEIGEVSDKPYVITLDAEGFDQFSFTLSGASSDARRYLSYTATEDGTFLYGTDNAKVIENAFGSTIKDMTTNKAVSATQEEQGGMFVYTWTVVAGHTYLVEQTLVNNIGKVDFLATFKPAEEGETMGKAIAVEINVPQDLGRKPAMPKYFKFTAPEAGNYLVSAQVQGYVRAYDAEGNSSSIQKDYSNGTEFHNGTFTLAEGESVVFSCEPSAEIEHIDVAIQDFFIPNYYAVVSKVGEVNSGMDISNPEVVEPFDEMTIDTYNIWYGPITVPAETAITVNVSGYQASNEAAAVFFANDKGQWITTKQEISYAIDGDSHSYTLAASSEERTIYLMSSGVTAGGTWTLDDGSTPPTPPAPQITYVLDVQPTLAIVDGKLVAKFTMPKSLLSDDNTSSIEPENIGVYADDATCDDPALSFTYLGGEGNYSAGDEVVFTFKLPEQALEAGQYSVTVNYGTFGTTDIKVNSYAGVLYVQPEIIEDIVVEETEIDLAKEQSLNIQFDLTESVADATPIHIEGVIYDKNNNTYPVSVDGTVGEGVSVNIAGLPTDAAYVLQVTSIAIGTPGAYVYQATADEGSQLYSVNFAVKAAAQPTSIEIGTPTLAVADQCLTLTFVGNNFAETCPSVDFNNFSEIIFASAPTVTVDGEDIQNVYSPDNTEASADGGPIRISSVLPRGGEYKVTINAGDLMIVTYSDDDYFGKTVYTNADDIVLTITVADDQTGINGIALDAVKTPVYTISGVRANTLQKGQVYIINGKKVKM